MPVLGMRGGLHQLHHTQDISERVDRVGDLALDMPGRLVHLSSQASSPQSSFIRVKTFVAVHGCKT